MLCRISMPISRPFADKTNGGNRGATRVKSATNHLCKVQQRHADMLAAHSVDTPCIQVEPSGPPFPCYKPTPGKASGGAQHTVSVTKPPQVMMHRVQTHLI